MNLPEIKQKALTLYYFSFDELSNNLREKILDAYYSRLHEEFSELFSKFREVDELVSRFKNILSENWELVKDTGLCYTAMPDNKVTQLMVGVALYVAKQDSESHPLELLMPGVALESCSSDYPDLNTDEYRTSSKIREVLKTYVMSSESEFLIPVKLLCHMAVSDDLNKISNPYYDYSKHDSTLTHLCEDELSRLFKHSRLTKAILAQKQQYTEISHNETHLLGQFQKLCERLRMSSRYGSGTR